LHWPYNGLVLAESQDSSNLAANRISFSGCPIKGDVFLTCFHWFTSVFLLIGIAFLKPPAEPVIFFIQKYHSGRHKDNRCDM
jgi:hypothetical protein